MGLAWLGARYDFGLALINIMTSVFRDYTPTMIGGLWGLLWGFLSSFVFGVLAASTYNCVCKCYNRNGSCGTCE